MSSAKSDNSVGRPTKYEDKYVDMILQHFDIKSGLDVEVENSKGVMQSVRHAADFPTLASFACEIGVHRETLLNWAKAKDDNDNLLHPEFFDAYKMAAEHQERILVQNGLKGGYSPAFAIFTAKNVLGWKDKTETEMYNPDGSMRPVDKVTIEVINATENKGD